jgi:hypothetical protein
MKLGCTHSYIINIMIKIYYLLTLVFLMYELYNIAKPYKLYNSKMITKDDTAIHINVRYFNLIGIMYIVWLYVGMFFTSHDRIFIAIILVNLITELFKRNKNYYTTVGLITTKSIVCAFLLAYLAFIHFSV